MTLTFYQILILFGAITLIVLASVIITGVLVYKTKYAGNDMFQKEHKPQGDAFNIPDDFTDDFAAEPVAPESKKLPEEIQKANEEFLEQFGMDRMIKEAAKYAEHDTQ